MRLHAGGERVGGVDQRIDLLPAQVVRQAGGAAEAADAPRDGRRYGRARAPGEGQHRVEPRVAGQRAGDRRGLRRSAQDQHAHAPGCGMTAPWLAIVGIGEDGYLSPPARAAVMQAGLVVGGRRHLALADAAISGRAAGLAQPDGRRLPRHPGPPRRAGRRAGFGRPVLLRRRRGAGARWCRRRRRVCHPAPSAFALARARLGWAAATWRSCPPAAGRSPPSLPACNPGRGCWCCRRMPPRPARWRRCCGTGGSARPAWRCWRRWVARRSASATAPPPPSTGATCTR